MSSQSISQPRSTPVEVSYNSLPAGSLYTLRARVEEQEKTKGSEPEWAREQAVGGSVYVWVTSDEWEALQEASPLTLPALPVAEMAVAA